MLRSHVRALLPGALLLMATLSGCRAAVTEILIAVDTDLAVPGELDALRIDLIGPSGEVRRAAGPLTRASDLPSTLALVHTEGPLGPIQITVAGRLGDRDVIQRRARVSFVESETRVLWIRLLRRCLEVRCTGGDETCGENGCRPIDVAASELVPWAGAISRFDGGALGFDDGAIDGAIPDGAAPDGCFARAEECNGRDDDCDGRIDEDFDLTMDMRHCGECGRRCPEEPPNAAGVCTDGSCRLICDATWADCDGLETNGCEAVLDSAATCGSCDTTCEDPFPLCVGEGPFECDDGCDPGTVLCGTSCVNTSTNPRHCGACMRVCSAPANAAADCVRASCTFRCDAGFFDCDLDALNGCESRHRELGNCGACGSACTFPNAVTSCSTGSCAIVGCEGGYANCDGSNPNGCEADLGRDPANCGSCGRSCGSAPPNGTSQCVDGACVLSCNPGFADCDRDPSNGCEASLRSTATCGSCGIRCDAPTPICAPDPAGGPGGVCQPACGEGRGDCDDDPTNGCETALDTLSNCGACGVMCELPGATATCATGVCALSECLPGRGNCDDSASNGCETNVLDSRSHCGACGNACPSGQQCCSGRCMAPPCR